MYIFARIYNIFILMDKLTQYYNLAAIFRDKYEQYEWNETVRRQKIYIFVSVIYLISFFSL